MSQTIVLVTFYSRGGATEQIATAAAVGAVQARAGIRMRRLPDPDRAAVLERYPQHRDSLRRMHKEYVAPREADIIAADVLVIASPPDVSADAPEWSGYMDLLAGLHARGALRGKVGAVVDGAAAGEFSSALERLGLSPVPPQSRAGGADEVARAIALGRAAVDLARTIKAG